ncbi:gas vesicle protein GvpJ [Staphylococcus equorum]|uniref:gas vesicle protein GvpJ n=1 Tax=Staphylococcus equorum TaxID=246432 RepID=UPI003D807B80
MAQAVQKSTDTSSLAEVIDRILDKGIVIDAYVRVSVVGIEILTIEARIVVASVDTWLRYAEAVGLLRDEVQDEGLENNSPERIEQNSQSSEKVEDTSQSKEKDGQTQFGI